MVHIDATILSHAILLEKCGIQVTYRNIQKYCLPAHGTIWYRWPRAKLWYNSSGHAGQKDISSASRVISRRLSSVLLLHTVRMTWRLFVLSPTREHSVNIFVGNLAYSATDQDLRQLFEQYGVVDKISVIIDRDTGRSKGFGFVEMPDSNA